MKRKSYEDFEQFEEDIKRFQHKCCSIVSQKYELKRIKRESKELIGYVKEKIELIRACVECFENSYNYGKSSVMRPCSKPHLLLWAKAQGYSSYWPAKVMTVNAQEKTVHVRFFGDYSKSILSDTNCFLYSKNQPDKKADQQKTYQKALKVSFKSYGFSNEWKNKHTNQLIN